MVLRIVAFEGIDRAGKSTQAQRAFAHFSASPPPGWSVAYMRYPARQDTPTGPLVASFLAGHTEMHPRAATLVLAANLWDSVDALERRHAGDERTLVIADRYAWSNAAYSCARGLDVGRAAALVEGVPVPALVVYMRIRPEDAAGRGGYGAERYERLDFQRVVAENMDLLAASERSVCVFDATADVDVLEGEIRAAILAAL